MTAKFSWRKIEYSVDGYLWSYDGDRNGMIVSRVDKKPIRGSKICPGMIQCGLSRGLDNAARRALELAQEKSFDFTSRSDNVVFRR